MSPAFPKTVRLTGGALLVLWAASFALSYVHLGAASLPVALSIAMAKAVLVVLFFMELARESLSMKLTLLSATGLLVILIGLMIADVVTRQRPALLAPDETTAREPARRAQGYTR